MSIAELSANSVTPCYNDDRDVGRFSDHITVWVDVYIGEDQNCEGLKDKFDANLQVLRTNNYAENEMNDDAMLLADQNMLAKLKEDAYCLKYFSSIDRALDFIRQCQDKRIFFISSGTIGKKIVPHIAELPQIHGIYIFCGNISHHTQWAGEYVDYISAMLDHQDDLLERLTRDIAVYLDKKGDRHRQNESMIAARNCYAWSLKLLNRGKSLGDTGSRKLIETVERKFKELQSFATAPSEL